LFIERKCQSFSYGSNLRPRGLASYLSVELHQLRDVLKRRVRFERTQVANIFEFERIAPLTPLISVPNLLGVLAKHEVHDVDALCFDPAELLAYWLQAAGEPFCESPVCSSEF